MTRSNLSHDRSNPGHDRSNLSHDRSIRATTGCPLGLEWLYEHDKNLLRSNNK